MFVQATRNTVSGLLLLGLLASVSSATEPPIKQDVVYKIHDDPNSPITFTIWLSLEEAAVDGNSIGSWWPRHDLVGIRSQCPHAGRALVG